MGRFISIERNANWGPLGVVKTTIAGLELVQQLRDQGYPHSVIFQAIKRATSRHKNTESDAHTLHRTSHAYNLLLELLRQHNTNAHTQQHPTT